MIRTLLLEQDPWVALILVLLSIFHHPVWLIALIGLCFFYRDEDRTTTAEYSSSSVLTSPCDGTVMEVSDSEIVVFLSPLDMHTQKSVADCVVLDTTYTPGTFYPAMWFEKSKFNERVTTRCRLLSNGSIVEIDQVAGQIARRIANWAHGRMNRGDTFGIIKFGSQCRVRVESGFVPLVTKGQRVFAGQTGLFSPIVNKR